MYWLGFTFSFNVIKQSVFCINQYKFLWTLEINIDLSLKASVNIVFKVHKNSYWPQQKTRIVYYYIMILFKQFYWLSCCHLTFRKIWYCLIKNRIDLVSLSFSNEICKKNHVNSISIRPMDIKVMWNFVQSESSY